MTAIIGGFGAALCWTVAMLCSSRASRDLGAFPTGLVGGDADRAEAFDAYAPGLVRKLYLEQRDGMESRR